MKIKVNEASGVVLDWMVAKAEQHDVKLIDYGTVIPWTTKLSPAIKTNYGFVKFNPSTNWAQGGPIIQREFISFRAYYNPESDKHGKYYAQICKKSGAMVHWSNKYNSTGATPLEAAMRCYVSYKLGPEVDVPEDLLR